MNVTIDRYLDDDGTYHAKIKLIRCDECGAMIEESFVAKHEEFHQKELRLGIDVYNLALWMKYSPPPNKK